MILSQLSECLFCSQKLDACKSIKITTGHRKLEYNNSERHYVARYECGLHKIGFSMAIQLLNDLFLLSTHSLFSLLFLFLLLIDPRGGRRVPLFASQYSICHPGPYYTILYTYSGAISTGTTVEYGERLRSASFHGCGTVKTNLGGMINTKRHLSLEGK